MHTRKQWRLPLVNHESTNSFILMENDGDKFEAILSGLFSSLSLLSSYHARISLHAFQDPEPIRLDVDERSGCVGKNNQNVKTINGHN
jgi:hypothetical protein